MMNHFSLYLVVWIIFKIVYQWQKRLFREGFAKYEQNKMSMNCQISFPVISIITRRVEFAERFVTASWKVYIKNSEIISSTVKLIVRFKLPQIWTKMQINQRKKEKQQQNLQVIEIEQTKSSYGEGNQLNSATHVLVLLTKPPGSVAFRQTTLHKAFKGVLNAKKNSFIHLQQQNKQNYKITPTTYTRLRLNVKK